MIAIDLSKQKEDDADPKAIQQYFSFLKKRKKQFQIFHKKVLRIYFILI